MVKIILIILTFINGTPLDLITALTGLYYGKNTGFIIGKNCGFIIGKNRVFLYTKNYGRSITLRPFFRLFFNKLI